MYYFTKKLVYNRNIKKNRNALYNKLASYEHSDKNTISLHLTSILSRITSLYTNQEKKIVENEFAKAVIDLK